MTATDQTRTNGFDARRQMCHRAGEKYNVNAARVRRDGMVVKKAAAKKTFKAKKSTAKKRVTKKTKPVAKKKVAKPKAKPKARAKAKAKK